MRSEISPEEIGQRASIYLLIAAGIVSIPGIVFGLMAVRKGARL
jgi:hypothetical protein